MRDYQQFFIDGRWIEPSGKRVFDTVNPATEQLSGRIRFGEQADVDLAVAAARRAFESYSRSSREERIALLERIGSELERHANDLAAAITEEMGCPEWLAGQAQVGLACGHVRTAIEILGKFEFDKMRGTSMLRRAPIGVCALITPWNFPVAASLTKLVPALATGCTAVLKPSEYSSFSAHVLAEILEAARVPPGVFNLVYGDGPTVGTALSVHPGVDMISITGSTRAGIEVARNAAATVKRVHQELGGKSPNLILDDADLDKAVSGGVRFVMLNSGQICSTPSRMIVPRPRLAEVVAIARATVEKLQVGSPGSGAYLGPVVNESQWNRIQAYIRKGIDEGATLVAGGLGKPSGLEQGYYVKPTVFADITQEMTIAREEIFGPVLAIEAYDDVDEAIRMANDTEYGLAAYVHAGSHEKARQVAERIRAGQVFINGDMDLFDLTMPFGGCKRSGNGREWGEAGFESCLEEIAFMGYSQPT